MEGVEPVGWFAAALQGIGALAVIIGLFLVLSPGVALAAVGVLAVVGGTVIEVGLHPRTAHPYPAMTASERRAHLVDDYRRTASER